MSLALCDELCIKGDDGVVLQGYWQEALPLRAIVVWIHGQGNWAGDFGDLAGELAGSGLAFAAFDLRGHGRSGGDRGVIRDYGQLLSDVESFGRKLTVLHPGVPLVLAGHSLGGGLAIRAAWQSQIPWVAMMAWAPWLKLGRSLWPLKPIIFLGSLLVPRLTISNGIQPDQLVADKEMALRIAQDKYRHVRISFRLLEAALDNGEFCMRKKSVFPFPVGVWHGLRDTVTRPGATQQWAQDCGVDYHPMPGLLHEVHWELGAQEMARRMVEWLNLRLDALNLRSTVLIPPV